MKKVLFVATVVKTHIMEFHLPVLELFKRNGWETAVAARNDYDDPAECVIPFCDTYYDIPFEREPLRMKNMDAFRMVKRIIEEGAYDIIHCHTPVGAVVARLAAIHARRRGTKVIYTAHGFHFYDGAPLKNWLLYYPVERFLSRWTDTLITINKEDYKRAKSSFHAKKTVYLPGVGVDLSKFDFELSVEEKAAKRTEMGVPEDAFVIMSVGELNRNKNHEVVIRALQKLGDDNIHYCIAGKGPLHDELLRLANSLGVSEQVHLLGYRRDVPELYKVSDICCLSSLREGLPVALIEAMASEIAAVAADNRGTRDLIVDGEEGFLCRHNDVSAFAERIKELHADQMLRERLSNNAKTMVTKFAVGNVVQVLKEIYGL